MLLVKEHTVWNEKYRPTTLENFICDETLKLKFQEFIDKQDICHLGFFGPPGSGKSTISKILAKNINCDYLYLNAVDNRSMEDMREKVGSFASTSSFKPLKIVILDEATHILQASQVMLLNMIETYSLKTRFILTGNFKERLIEPLRSRLQEFDLTPPTKKQIGQHVVDILKTENIQFKVEDIAEVINKFYPDIRKIINSCQKYTINGVLTIKNLTDPNYLNKILDELKNPTYKSFNNIRQILADNEISEYETLYRFLFDKIDEYGKNDVVKGVIIITIADYLYKSNSILDKEINFCACLSNILKEIK